VAELVIGVDFDNTLINYDEVFHSRAVDSGLVARDIEKEKSVIRDRVRNLEAGEEKWQKLQAEVYGPGITEARPCE